MFKKTTEDRESGFTLIEALVGVLIVGTLMAVSTPVFINQKKVAVDAVVSDNVNTSIVAVEGYLQGTGTSDVVIPNLTTLGIKPTNGVDIVITGTSYGYCITGSSKSGDTSASKGYIYASGDNKVSTEGYTCEGGYFTQKTFTPVS